jgi:hypothetical protein
LQVQVAQAVTVERLSAGEWVYRAREKGVRFKPEGAQELRITPEGKLLSPITIKKGPEALLGLTIGPEDQAFLLRWSGTAHELRLNLRGCNLELTNGLIIGTRPGSGEGERMGVYFTAQVPPLRGQQERILVFTAHDFPITAAEFHQPGATPGNAVTLQSFEPPTQLDQAIIPFPGAYRPPQA